MKKSLFIYFVVTISLLVFLGLNFRSITNQRGNYANIESRLLSMSDENLEKLTEKLLELKTETLLKPLDENSEPVKLGDRIAVHYRGWTASDGKVFDKSNQSSPLSFIVGSGVIEGFSKGVVGMKNGEVRRIKIPSAMAYGENSPDEAKIPKNADLIFDIELLKII